MDHGTHKFVFSHPSCAQHAGDSGNRTTIIQKETDEKIAALDKRVSDNREEVRFLVLFSNTHTHTHIYIYIYKSSLMLFRIKESNTQGGFKGETIRYGYESRDCYVAAIFRFFKLCFSPSLPSNTHAQVINTLLDIVCKVDPRLHENFGSRK